MFLLLWLSLGTYLGPVPVQRGGLAGGPCLAVPEEECENYLSTEVALMLHN